MAKNRNRDYEIAHAINALMSSLENWTEIQDSEDARDCDQDALEQGHKALALLGYAIRMDDKDKIVKLMKK